MTRRYILLRSLSGRIAERQAPPPVVQDREQWQKDYVARSQAGTDIRSATGRVGASGTDQAEMNAMTPAERMARLKQIAATPSVPHYHALANGQIAWGHGGEGTTPLKPGDKLIAYRGIEKKPTELRVHSLKDTHLGQGMRVMHPDRVPEDMHGPPLHPMHLASAQHVAAPYPHPLRPRVLMKSKKDGRRKRKLLATRALHSPRQGKEGRDQHGSDAWYHGAWLLQHDPDVARSCGLGERDASDAADSAGEGAAAPLAQSLVLAKAWFGRRTIRKPGSRGGKYYYDQRGQVVYGERPGPHFREAQVGDHVATDQGVGRVNALGPEGIATSHHGTVTPDQIHEMAPGHHQGDELSPRMQDALPEGQMPGAGALRRRMMADPMPGDRAQVGGEEHTVERVDGDDVTLSSGGAQAIMPREHYRRRLDEAATPLPPDEGHPRRRDTAVPAKSPRQVTADAMRATMENPPPASATDTSADPPEQAVMRAGMARRPWPGDLLTVARPLALDGNSYEPGRSYTVTWADDDEPEICDTWGRPVATLTTDQWRSLVSQNAVIPTKRGDPPPDESDPQIPGEGVFGVFEGQVSKAEVAAAWTGSFAGGYSTKVDTMAEGTGNVKIAGSIMDRNGDYVGQFERHVYRSGKGVVHVEHALMEVFHDMKIGFADDFNRQAEASYREWGVDHVNVYADISVGKYAWAMQGYTFTLESEREDMIGRFDGWCKAHGHTIPDARILQMQHPWDIAGYTDGPEVRVQGHPRTRGGTDWAIDGTFNLGKAFFLADPDTTAGCSGAWHGVKVLTDPDHPTERQSRRYRKGKR